MFIRIALLAALVSSQSFAAEIRFKGVDSRLREPCDLTLFVDDATGKVVAMNGRGRTNYYELYCSDGYFCHWDNYLDLGLYSDPGTFGRMAVKQKVSGRRLSLVIPHTDENTGAGSFVARLKVKGYPNQIEEFTWRRTLRALGIRIFDERIRCVDLKQDF
jgi:hypothetical protein